MNGADIDQLLTAARKAAWSGARASIWGVRDALTQVVMPGVCLACDEPVANVGSCCDACLLKLSELESVPRCERCASKLPEGAACASCGGKGLRPFVKIATLGGYDEPARNFVLATKYGKKWWCGEWLGMELARCESVARVMAGAEVIVPVPLHRWRLMWRGFNQAELIARALEKFSDARIENRIVRRRRRTRPQAVLASRTARVANVKDAFELIDAKTIESRHVVIADDILTTGATLRAVARVLQRARPASISAVVVCVADRPPGPRV